MAKSRTNDWISLAAASERAGISQSTLRRWIATGKVESRVEKKGSLEQRVVNFAKVEAQATSKTSPPARSNGRAKSPRTASPPKAASSSTDHRSTDDLFSAALERLTREAERAGRFEAEIRELRGSLARSMSELENKTQLESELEQARAQVHDLEAKVASLSEEIDRFTADTSEKAMLEWSRAEAAADARSAEQQLEEVTLELREARAAALLRDRAESEAAERLVRVSALESELESTRSELAQMSDRVRELEGEIDQRDAELAGARASAQRAEATAEKKHHEAQATIVDLTIQSSADRDLIDSLRVELEKKEQRHIEALALTASLQEELETARTTALRIPELEAELIDARGYADRKQRRRRVARGALMGVALLLLMSGFVARGVGGMNYELYGGSTSISATDEGAEATVTHRGGRIESFSGGYAEARAWLDDRTEALRAEDRDASDARLAMSAGGWLASMGAALLALRLLFAIAGKLRRRANDGASLWREDPHKEWTDTPLSQPG